MSYSQSDFRTIFDKVKTVIDIDIGDFENALLIQNADDDTYSIKTSTCTFKVSSETMEDGTINPERLEQIKKSIIPNK